MRQSLVVGARPAYTKNRPFPRVPLGPGNWRIETERRQDSKVALTVWKQVSANHGGTYTVPSVAEIPLEENRLFLQGPCVVSAEITDAGRENFISVFAYPMNGQL